MANFYGSCRTNYFTVKDPDAFIAAMAPIPSIDVVRETHDSFLILGDDPDGGTWPAFVWDDDGDETEIDLMTIVSEHLIDGEVAIFMEAGAEKLRYITGCAVAINNKGEVKAIGLQDIYNLAKELTDRPDDITTAEY